MVNELPDFVVMTLSCGSVSPVPQMCQLHRMSPVHPSPL